MKHFMWVQFRILCFMLRVSDLKTCEMAKFIQYIYQCMYLNSGCRNTIFFIVRTYYIWLNFMKLYGSGTAVVIVSYLLLFFVFVIRYFFTLSFPIILSFYFSFLHKIIKQSLLCLAFCPFLYVLIKIFLRIFTKFLISLIANISNFCKNFFKPT